MKRFVGSSLAVVLLFCIALCTPVVASVTYIKSTGDYTCETDSVFIFKSPKKGWYAINSYDNTDPFLNVKFDGGTTHGFDNTKNGLEFCAYLHLEKGEEIHCETGSYGDDEVINFRIRAVVEAKSGKDYNVPTGSYFYFTSTHDDYYQLNSFDNADPYVEIQLPDGSTEFLDDEKDCEFFGGTYIRKGDKIFFSVNDYDGLNVKFKISCDCSAYPDFGYQAGNTYKNIPSGTQFTFKAPVEGLYLFESVSGNDPRFEYIRNDMFSYSFDDVDSKNKKLGFKVSVYLTSGEKIHCYLGEKTGKNVSFSISYKGICKHKGKKWVDYKSATVFDSGIKTQICKECSFIFSYKETPQLKLGTPVTSAMNTRGGVSVSWNVIDGVSKYVVYRKASGEKSWTRIQKTTSTTYLDKSAKNNKTYYYFVRAFNTKSDYSDYDSGRIAKIKYVATPKLTKISNLTTGVRVDWSKVTGATGYRVYRRKDGIEYWTYLGTTKNPNYIDTSVKSKNGTGYSYTVRAINDGDSGFDAEGLYTKRLSDPVMKSAVSSKQGITVKWGSVKGSQSYYVYRKTANSGWVRLATVKGVNNVTYVDKTAKKGVTYTYTAKAVNGKHISAYSSTISCKDKY